MAHLARALPPPRRPRPRPRARRSHNPTQPSPMKIDQLMLCCVIRADAEHGFPIRLLAARHLHRDRRTVRDYLTGQRVPGVRRPGPDPLDLFANYCQRRFTDDPTCKPPASSRN